MEYTALVTKIQTRPHPDADRIQIGSVCGIDVIIGLEVQDGDIGLYFAPDGQLSIEFAEANNLIEKVDPETGIRTGGYFGGNRRVKAQTFRGVKSYGFWIPISSLGFALHGEEVSFLVGTEISNFSGVPICNKYITPATLAALRGKKGLVRRANSCFAKHFDTKHWNKSLKLIPLGASLYFSEKLEGTSGRTGYLLDKYTHKRTLWQAFCCGLMGMKFKRNIPSSKYTTVSGTRNVILKDREQPGYYGEEEFRGIIEDKVKGKLRKGEILYYEIVGFTTTGKPIQPGVQIKDKVLKKQYGKVMSYSYGCKEKECEMYVYRIVNANEDGVAIDLSWPQVMKRCRELDVKHVPNLGYGDGLIAPFINYGDSETMKRIVAVVKIVEDGPSTIDPSHIREGVVIRVESEDGVTAYKSKSHTYLTLEGRAKDNENYVDIEESS